jgi:hypothetical protein
MSKNVSQKQFHRFLAVSSLAIAVVLVVGAGLLLMGKQFAGSQVKTQLVQEKIAFPAANSAGLSATEFPGLQQYAGQAVDSGVKAKAYADEYIWVHMMAASGNKTYAEASAAAMAAPTDTKLAGIKATLFQGDMLRSSLLTAYAFSVLGIIAGYAAIACLIGAILFLLGSLLALSKAAREK